MHPTTLLPDLLFLLPSLASAACTNFEPSIPQPYRHHGPEIQASIGVVCDHNNSSCFLGDYRSTPNRSLYPLNAPVGSLISVSSTLNLSTSDATVQDSLYTLIGTRVNLTFYEKLWSNITNFVGFPIAPGQAGYAIFEPTMQCTSGTLDGCSGEGYPVNGTGVEACTPLRTENCESGGDFPCVPGLFDFKNTTVNEAKGAIWNHATEVKGDKATAWNGGGRNGPREWLGVVIVVSVVAFLA